MTNKAPQSGPFWNRNNPWQILVVAGMLFLPGLLMLLHRGSAAFPHQIGRTGLSVLEVQPEETVHVYGLVLLIMSLVVVAFYFYIRRQIRLDEQFPHRKKR